MGVLPACMSAPSYSQRPEKGVGSPGMGVTDRPELLHKYWELNLGSPEEQQVLLTADAFL